MVKAVGILAVGIAFLGWTLHSKLACDNKITEKELMSRAAIDDPGFGMIIPPDKLPKASGDNFLLLYLPECTSCSAHNVVPSKASVGKMRVIGVARDLKSSTIPLYCSGVIEDVDGSLQMALNAYKQPRGYLFQGRQLVAMQRLDEESEQFVQRVNHGK